MSQPAAVSSASLARSSPRCQLWSSLPRFPSGLSRLWARPATKPSSEIDMWQVVSGISLSLRRRREVAPRVAEQAAGDQRVDRIAGTGRGGRVARDRPGEAGGRRRGLLYEVVLGEPAEQRQRRLG